MTRKTLLAAACSFVFTAQAFAGASLGSLVNGGSLFSGDGTLEFSDFAFLPIINAPSSGDIQVITLDNGLLFGGPLFTDSSTGIIDFNVSYTVRGNGVSITSASLQSTGSSTGGGQSGVFQVVEDDSAQGLANLTNVFTANTTISNTTFAFEAQDSIFVRSDIFASPGSGTAGLSDFSQTFGTETLDDNGGETGPTVVPSPTAALAGMALLGAIALRRRRA